MTVDLRSRRSVLHLVAPAAFGGIESVVRTLAMAFRSAGREVRVAALLQEEGPHPFVERLHQSGVPVTEIRCGRRHYLAEARAVAELCRTLNTGLIHTHNYHADFVGLIASHGLGVPIVTTVHGFSAGDFKNRVYEWLDLWLLRRFDGVICVSEETRRRVLRAGCPPRLITLIQNGYAPGAHLPRLEARESLGLASSARVIGWVGRLNSDKGPDLLIEAVAHLSDREARVVVIGDGSERQRMLDRSEALGIEPERLQLVGPKNDASLLLPAFDVLVLSSRTEGTPMVLLEAMSAGVPVVTFAVGGVPQVLDESAAWLVEPGDVEGLAAAMDNALAQPDEASRRAAIARAILTRRFGLEQWISQVEAVYRQALIPASPD